MCHRDLPSVSSDWLSLLSPRRGDGRKRARIKHNDWRDNGLSVCVTGWI